MTSSQLSFLEHGSCPSQGAMAAAPVHQALIPMRTIRPLTGGNHEGQSTRAANHPFYPHHAGCKEMTTSFDAACRVEESGICDWLRSVIPSILENEPMTAKELTARFAESNPRINKDLVKPRLTELKIQGKIAWQKDGVRYVTRNGEHVWERVV